MHSYKIKIVVNLFQKVLIALFAIVISIYLGVQNAKLLGIVLKNAKKKIGQFINYIANALLKINTLS